MLKSKNFSNARFVRNLFERTCGKATMRARLAGEAAVVLTKEDLRAAGSDREFAAMMEKNRSVWASASDGENYDCDHARGI